MASPKGLLGPVEMLELPTCFECLGRLDASVTSMVFNPFHENDNQISPKASPIPSISVNTPIIEVKESKDGEGYQSSGFDNEYSVIPCKVCIIMKNRGRSILAPLDSNPSSSEPKPIVLEATEPSLTPAVLEESDLMCSEIKENETREDIIGENESKLNENEENSSFLIQSSDEEIRPNPISSLSLCATISDTTLEPTSILSPVKHPRSSLTCEECGENSNLWICLLCGYVGCGRLSNRHSLDHYVTSDHSFSMEIDTHRVWDYYGDRYVHRFPEDIPVFTDTSEIEQLTMKTQKSGGFFDGSDDRIKKFESLSLECNAILAAELESQLYYFEGQVGQLNAAKERNETSLEGIKEIQRKEETEHQEKMDSLKTDLESQTNKLKILQNEKVFLDDVLPGLREKNATLIDKQKEWNEKLVEVRNRISESKTTHQRTVHEMKEQITDLTFYVRTSKQVSNSSEELQKEIQSGGLMITQAPGNGGKKKRRKGRRNR
eukprot:TRINITY_DN43654_c0_g1_i1.p1 TRINITY_DN43654_c0_g1~~TRINITY_DN43654_c0_g1_i1.p1  ORF type:complete len:508 (+),score=129.99 TRINITY_DN43654_c0_g1_i1:49-1524(+)